MSGKMQLQLSGVHLLSIMVLQLSELQWTKIKSLAGEARKAVDKKKKKKITRETVAFVCSQFDHTGRNQ